MDEAAARRWLGDTFAVPRETWEQIETFIALLAEENRRQNLVSAASLDVVWNRHIVDSAQLLRLAPERGAWADIGAGAGFPGLIVALLRADRVTLIEPRRLRADFLQRMVERLGLTGQVTILAGRVEQVPAQVFDVISARAFAPLTQLLASSIHLTAFSTHWVLPKGRNAKSELEAARASWQGVFCLEPSASDPDAYIIVAEQVRRISKGRRG